MGSRLKKKERRLGRPLGGESFQALLPALRRTLRRRVTTSQKRGEMKERRAFLTEISDQISWLALVTGAQGEAAHRCQIPTRWLRL